MRVLARLNHNADCRICTAVDKWVANAQRRKPLRNPENGSDLGREPHARPVLSQPFSGSLRGESASPGASSE